MLANCRSDIAFLSQPRDFRPTGDQGVVGQRIMGALATFAEGKLAVGKIAGGFGLFGANRMHCRQHLGGLGFAAVQGADQLMDDFPDGQPDIPRRIPVGGQFRRGQQAHLAAPGGKNAGFHHAGDAGVLGGA